jgi:putative tricarboxylic transport membrane protein
MNVDMGTSPNLPPHRHLAHILIGCGAMGLGALIGFGALSIPSNAGYAGVGPNFLPWVVAVALCVCGALLARQGWTGGYRDMEPPTGAQQGDWRALAWVGGGLLTNAFLIERAGFIVACTLCFVLAARGLRLAKGEPPPRSAWLSDTCVGALIAAPTYWLFTKGLAISLPGLTSTGWF